MASMSPSPSMSAIQGEKIRARFVPMGLIRLIASLRRLRWMRTSPDESHLAQTFTPIMRLLKTPRQEQLRAPKRASPLRAQLAGAYRQIFDAHDSCCPTICLPSAVMHAAGIGELAGSEYRRTRLHPGSESHWHNVLQFTHSKAPVRS